MVGTFVPSRSHLAAVLGPSIQVRLRVRREGAARVQVEVERVAPARVRGQPILTALALFGRKGEEGGMLAAEPASQHLPDAAAVAACRWLERRSPGPRARPGLCPRAALGAAGLSVCSR